MAGRYPGRLREAGCPVLVLVGSGDTVTDPGAARSLAGEGVEVREIEGLHDLLHERDAGATVDLIRDWIGQRVSSP
jgi:alpha-beta hydrolase superfamily lysophospholipase